MRCSRLCSPDLRHGDDLNNRLNFPIKITSSTAIQARSLREQYCEQRFLGALLENTFSFQTRLLTRATIRPTAVIDVCVTEAERVTGFSWGASESGGSSPH